MLRGIILASKKRIAMDDNIYFQLLKIIVKIKLPTAQEMTFIVIEGVYIKFVIFQRSLGMKYKRTWLK